MMHASVACRLGSLAALMLLAVAACSRNDSTASGSGGSGHTAITGCGVTCSASEPCTGQGVTCQPAAKGGMMCKASTCPACDPGKFCLSDKNTCEPTGCGSLACGFPYLGACDDCVKANCCAVNVACASDPDCSGIVNCRAECATDACKVACSQAAPPAAAAKYNAAFSCDGAHCNAECYDPAPSGGSSSGGTGANGCPVDYPVKCPGTLCCPAAYPTCGGGCGTNCCPSSAGASSSSGGAGTGTCPGGCASGSLCISAGGTSSCAPACTTNAQCSTGCCASLSGTSLRACLSASYCGSTGSSSSGGGGGTCTNLTSCVSLTQRTTTGACGTGPELLGTLANGCGQAAHCRVCSVSGGVINQSLCEVITVAAGSSVGGEASGMWWCTGDTLKYVCAAATDPTTCVNF